MQGNAVLAVIAGIVSALVGAVIWAVVTVATGYQIGWMAVGVGFLVGIAVMVAGQGEGGLFGTIGAVCALLGCVLGNLFTGIGMVANAEGLGYIETLTGTFGVLRHRGVGRLQIRLRRRRRVACSVETPKQSGGGQTANSRPPLRLLVLWSPGFRSGSGALPVGRTMIASAVGRSVDCCGSRHGCQRLPIGGQCFVQQVRVAE